MRTLAIFLTFLAIAGFSQAKPATNLEEDLLNSLIKAQDLIDKESKLNALQQDGDEDEDFDDEAAAQFWGLLARHAGRHACKHLNSRPEVLEQNIDEWMDKDAKIMQDETYDYGGDNDAALQKFGRRIKKFWKKHGSKIRKIGRGVCKAVNYNAAVQDYEDTTPGDEDEDEDYDNEVAAQFFGLLAKHAGRYACKRLNSRPDVLEQDIDTWLNKDAKIMEEDDDDAALQKLRLGRRIKKFWKNHGSKIRKIGRGVCKAVNYNAAVQDYEDTTGDKDEDYDDEVAAQFFGLLAKHAGRYACKRLNSRPDILEQDIDTWVNKDAKIMEEDDDDAALQKLRLGRRIKKFWKSHGSKIRKIGSGVCKVIG